MRRESWSGELVKRQTANDNCSEVLSKSRRLVSSFYHASWACGDLTVYLHGLGRTERSCAERERERERDYDTRSCRAVVSG